MIILFYLIYYTRWGEYGQPERRVGEEGQFERKHASIVEHSARLPVRHGVRLIVRHGVRHS